MRHSERFSDRRAATVIAVTTAKRAARSGALWGAVFGLFTAFQANAYTSTYPTPATRAKFALTFGHNAGIAALVGSPHQLETVAGYMSWRLGVLSIIGAIWGLLLATKLLRGEEEAGRWELLLTGQTSRRRAAGQAIAGLGVGLAVMWALIGLLTALAGTSAKINFSAGASLFYATAAIASAAMFLAIGVLVGQICETRRQANGIVAAIFGASFLIRMVADTGSGLQWLRWGSPLGWIEELRPLIDTRPLALIPIVGLIAGAVTGALAIAARRDLGASVLASRETANPHTRMLNGPGGLTVRLGRSVALGWIAGLAVLGLVMGLVAQSASASINGSKTLEQTIFRLGGKHGGADSYLGIAFIIAAALVAFAAAGQITSTRGDEEDGHVDNLLVRPVARARWLADRLVFGAVAIIVMGLAAGIAAWIGAISQHSAVSFGALVLAGLNIAAPALFVLGIGALVYGLRPRVTAPVLYGLVAWSFIVEIVGGAIKANHWLLDTAVLSHIAPAPAANPNWIAVAWLVGLGLIAALTGIVGFNRRDLASA